jgi:YidC/Oxa1 family membrane protein insertase
MDNIRTILWALFACMAFLTWTQWQVENGAPPESVAASETVASPAPVESLPTINAEALPDPSTTAEVSNSAPVTADAPASAEQPEGQLINVSTDVLDIQISTIGGTLVSGKLKKYPVSKDNPDLPVQLLNNAADATYLIQTGLVDSQRSGPTHITELSSAANSYVLNGDSLEVPLTWTNAAGVQVQKVFRFYRGRYNIDIEYRVENASGTDWQALNYVQIRRRHNPPERSMFNVDSYSYDGAVYYDGDKYSKVDPEDLADEPFKASLTGGWIAFIQHHFLTAAVPTPDKEYVYDATFANGNLTMRTSGPLRRVSAGETAVFESQLFVGPKLQSQLEETAPELELTVDYGLLALLAKPLFWLLDKVHSFVGNWGWSIILVTFIIKLAFYKLTEASGKSMAKMRKLQPRLKALQERYKEDRQALSTHMMDLYKKEKVNPAAGCLPMLIQIPFFIAFYWVLLESVEMRQAPFALWINDLSTRDPFFVLPLLMGIAMFFQQKLNPAPPDPVQATVMQILPIMFTVFFAFFPAGLVLYWLTNSVLSIAQQWNINRKLGAD